MPEQRDIKVFISWSGDLAQDIAVALRGWLPLLFDRVEPWASDVDIAAGQRSLAQIEAELENTNFGIVVLTDANQHRPWVNFEAGAMSKVIPGGDIEQRVVPLLVDLDGPAQVTGPLSQFQSEKLDRDGMLSLLKSLATVAGIDLGLTEQRFNVYWPQLEDPVGVALLKDEVAKPAVKKRDQDEVIDEVLEIVRTIQRNTAPIDIPPDWTPSVRRSLLDVPLNPKEQDKIRAQIRDTVKNLGFPAPTVDMDAVGTGTNAVARVIFNANMPERDVDKVMRALQRNIPYPLLFVSSGVRHGWEGDEEEDE